MLTEGLLALTALGAYMSITEPEVLAAGYKWGAHTAFAYGASKLVAPIFMTTWDNPMLKTFYGAFIVLYAITINQLANQYRIIRIYLYPCILKRITSLICHLSIQHAVREAANTDNAVLDFISYIQIARKVEG